MPVNLDECCKLLDNLPDRDTKVLIKKDNPVKLHSTLGMWIRNNWGLWEQGPLYQYFYKMGLRHQDDMSSIILFNYKYYLNGIKYDVDVVIKYFQEYWENVNFKQSMDYK